MARIISIRIITSLISILFSSTCLLAHYNEKNDQRLSVKPPLQGKSKYAIFRNLIEDEVLHGSKLGYNIKDYTRRPRFIHSGSRSAGKPENSDNMEAIRQRLGDKTLKDVIPMKEEAKYKSRSGSKGENDLHKLLCIMDCQMATAFTKSQSKGTQFRSGKKGNVTEAVEKAWSEMIPIEREFMLQLVKNASVGKPNVTDGLEEIGNRITQGISLRSSGGISTLQVFQVFSSWCVDNCGSPEAISTTVVNTSKSKKQKLKKNSLTASGGITAAKATVTFKDYISDESEESSDEPESRIIKADKDDDHVGDDVHDEHGKMPITINLASIALLEQIFPKMDFTADWLHNNLLCLCDNQQIDRQMRCQCRDFWHNKTSPFIFKGRYKSF